MATHIFLFFDWSQLEGWWVIRSSLALQVCLRLVDRKWKVFIVPWHIGWGESITGAQFCWIDSGIIVAANRTLFIRIDSVDEIVLLSTCCDYGPCLARVKSAVFDSEGHPAQLWGLTSRVKSAILIEVAPSHAVPAGYDVTLASRTATIST
jgi:hypothetical protein